MNIEINLYLCSVELKHKEKMEITTKHYGGSRIKPSGIIEIKIVSNGGTLIDDITNYKGYVDENFISNLRDIANELEEQNKRIEQLSA